jgi:hypothetical protein
MRETRSDIRFRRQAGLHLAPALDAGGQQRRD